MRISELTLLCLKLMPPVQWLRRDSDRRQVARATVCPHHDRGRTSRDRVRQPEGHLHEVEARYYAEVFGRYVEDLIVTAYYPDHYG